MARNPFIGNPNLTAPYFFLPRDRSIMCIMVNKEDIRCFEEVFKRSGSSITWSEDRQYRQDKKHEFSEDDIQFLKANAIKL